MTYSSSLLFLVVQTYSSCVYLPPLYRYKKTASESDVQTVQKFEVTMVK